MNLRFTLFAAGFLCASGLFAQGNGQNNFQVLQTVSAARIAALGGNSIAVKDGDINLGLVAPSLLDSTSAEQIAFSYTRFFGEANITHAAYAHYFREIGTVSFMVKNLGYGSFDMTDETGTTIGNFSAGEYVFQVGVGRQLDEHFSLGANIKYVFSEMAEYKSSALAADISTTYYQPEKQFTATLLMKNIGRPISTYRDGIDENLPFEIQMALSKKLSKAPLRFQLVGENLQTWDLTPTTNQKTEIDPLTGEVIAVKSGGFGENLARHLVFNAEILLTKNFNIRLGYNYNRRKQLLIEEKPGGAGITYGLGIRIAKIHLSYARAAYSLAGVSNNFTVAVKFSDFKKS